MGINTTKFDKEIVEQLRSEIQKALDDVVAKHIKETSDENKEASLAPAEEKSEHENKVFQAMKKFVEENNLARSINKRTLMAYNTRKWKRPITYKDVDGKLYDCTKEQAKVMFRKTG